ncbi:reverse transcriptase domain-containing protein [Tanacetum coccineum]
MNQPVNSIQNGYETYGGPHVYYECQATDGYTQEDVYATMSTFTRVGVLLSNTIPNPCEDLKVITTRSGITLAGPSIPSPPSSSSKVVERDPESTTDQVLTESTTRVPPLVVQPSPTSTSFELHPAHVSSPMIPEQNPYQPPIPYPSRLNKEKLQGKLESCKALADLGANINLMPLSLWKKLSLPELTPTRMTVELATRIVAYPPGIAEDVFVQVGKFTFPTDFVVVDYDVDPRTSEISRSGDELYKMDILDTTCEDHFHEDSDFILEEIDTFLASNDSTPPNVNDGTFDMVGDIRLIETLLNNDILNDIPPHLHVFMINEIEKIKSFIDDPSDLELKDLPPHLEYVFLEGTSKLPIMIPKNLKREEKEQLLKDDFKAAVQHQRWVNPKIHEVIKAEVIKLLDAGLIYPISDSPWVSPVHVVPKKEGMTVVTNENNEFIPTRLVMGWRIPIDPQDQEKTTFTCPYGTFAYRRMPFGLFNSPGTFQRCMVAIFHDMIEKTMEVFMDDFSAFGNSFSSCLSHIDMMLKRCEDTNLVLNWEKCHFMVKEGIVLDHKISKNGIKVDKAKVDVIAKLPPLTMVKEIRSFLGHAGFYRRFIQDFSKIARPMTHLLEKDTPFFFSSECQSSFEILKKKLTEAPILTIVYTDHSALKYLFAKQDAKPRFLRWILLLQEFNIEIRDKKRSRESRGRSFEQIRKSSSRGSRWIGNE